MRLKVQENAALERDPESNAIVNTDSDGYNAALARKHNKRMVKGEIDDLKSEVSELKDLVKTLINRLNK